MCLWVAPEGETEAQEVKRKAADRCGGIRRSRESVPLCRGLPAPRAPPPSNPRLWFLILKRLNEMTGLPAQEPDEGSGSLPPNSDVSLLQLSRARGAPGHNRLLCPPSLVFGKWTSFSLCDRPCVPRDRVQTVADQGRKEMQRRERTSQGTTAQPGARWGPGSLSRDYP